MNEQALQDRYAPHNACFGCGPANTKGLRLKSVVDGEETVCTWMPEKHHEAFPGVLSGGICGTLLDCHSNWTAAWALMRRAGAASPPCTVTSDFHVTLKRPPPTDVALSLRAKEQKLVILDGFNLGETKTKKAVAALAKLGLENALIVDDKSNENLARSVRNLESFKFLPPEGLNLYDIHKHHAVVLTAATAKALQERLS